MVRYTFNSVAPAVSAAFLASAFLFLCGGVGLGLYMAASHDHSLSPVHAHTNLLGWVTSAIMGLFYARFAPLGRWAVWAQFAIYTIGVICMMIGLYGVLKEIPVLLPVVAIGSTMTVIGLGMFGWAVSIVALQSWRGPTTPGAGPVYQTWESG